jgi:putative transposase
MSNHLHLIISRALDGQKLSDIVRDFKKFTSSEIIKAIEKNKHESRRNCLPVGQTGMLWIFFSYRQEKLK